MFDGVRYAGPNGMGPYSTFDSNQLYRQLWDSSAGNPPSNPPHLQFTLDTIGQTIFRSIGDCRLPLRTIWVQGIANAGDVLPEGATSWTFAAALCAPFDPTETGDFAALYDGNDLIFTPDDGVTPPVAWSAGDQELLLQALTNATFYPGDEAQEPDPLIVADKGAEIANAFRGLRYIVVPGYPLRQPQLSVIWTRNNSLTNARAVEFAAGAD